MNKRILITYYMTSGDLLIVNDVLVTKTAHCPVLSSMRTDLFILVILLSIQWSDASTTRQYGVNIDYTCPTGWQNITTSCFKVFGMSETLMATWENAYSICHGYGAMLATMRDYDLNEMIGEFAYREGASMYWIGMSEKNISPQNGINTTWNKDVMATVYEGKWSIKNPETADGDCVYVSRMTDKSSPVYKWSISNCKTKMPFICEKTSCPAGSFHCNNNECINDKWVCDGSNECGDYSDELNCTKQCRETLTAASGEIRSPNYPSNYNSSQVCLWTIIGMEGSNIFLNFTTFMTESNVDVVEILKGGRTEPMSEVIARLSGTPDISTLQYRSFNNYMMIRFTTGSQSQMPGFSATYRAYSDNYDKEVYLTAMNSSSMLIPPLFSSSGLNSYLGYRDYVWIITSAERRKIITLEREMINLMGSDYIEVRNGNSASDALLARYDAKNNDGTMWTLTQDEPPEGPKYVLSTSNQMYVYMKTSRSTAAQGFKFNYRQGCEITYTGDYGEIFSPGYPNANYANYQLCTWTIDVASGKGITLFFDSGFELEDGKDFLEVYTEATDTTGSSITSGTDGFDTASLALNQPFYSSNGKMHIRFIPNAVINKKGFRALYSIGCPAASFTPGTSVTGTNNNRFKDSFSVSCDLGYSFLSEEFTEANVNIVCKFGGKWLVKEETRVLPMCKPLYCGVPEDVTNGYIAESNGVVFGSYVTIKCFPGYSLSGSANLTCQANEKWSTPPTCTAASCLQAGVIANGKRTVVNGSLTDYASIIKYECNDGYELVGEPILFCESTGAWSATFPTCKKLHCPLPEVMNGMWSTATMPLFDDTISISCMTGYKLSSGSGQFKCLANQTFGELPTCDDIDECSEDTDGCQQNCKNTIGSFVCSCPDGYVLNSNKKDCDDIDECDINNGGCGQKCNDNDGGYSCSCDVPGYTLFDEDGTSGYRIPTSETGTMYHDTYYLNHTCVRVSCPMPAVVNNSNLMTEREISRYGDKIKYFCNLGYVMSPGSMSEFTCDANGQWTPTTFPTCEVATCQPDTYSGLTNPPTSVVPSTAVNYLQYVNISCNVPGKGTFMKQRQCLYDKGDNSYKLYGAEYECGVFDCGNPGQMDGTEYVIPPVTTYGAIINFRCSTLMSINGNSSLGNTTVTCRADGNWDFGSLQCFGSVCSDPGFPAGGYQVSNGFSLNDVVSFGCNKTGYSLSGPTQIKCVLNSAGNGLVWNTTDRPTCVDTQKPQLFGCSSDQAVNPYTPITVNLPTATDNTAIKSIEINPPNGNTTLTIETANVTVNFTVSDFAGNSDSCSTTFTVNDVEKPNVVCPASKTETITTETESRTVTVDDSEITSSDNVGVVSTVKTSLVVNRTYIGTTREITVTVTDAAGLFDTCRVQVYTTWASCSEYSISAPLNGKKNCSASSNGYVCDLTCNDNYAFIDEPTQTTKTVSCVSGGTWDIIPACTPVLIFAQYTLEFDVVYNVSVASQTISESCTSSYSSAISGMKTSVENQLKVSCTLVASGGISVSLSSWSVDVTAVDQITVKYTVEQVPRGFTLSQYRTCGDFLETAFKSNLLPLKQLSPSQVGCPNVSSPDPLSTQQSNEGYLCPSTQKKSTINNVDYCLKCPFGMYSTGPATCSNCPVGTYKAFEGADACLGCTSGRSTYREGSTSSSACLVECGAGTTSSNGLPPCTQCPKNSFWSNSTHCQPCPTGQITLNAGATSQSECQSPCPAGSYAYNGYQPNCVPCPMNYYQSQTGQTGCIQCSADKHTANTGSNAASDCVDVSICASTPCARGTCEVQNHSYKCNCPAGYYGQNCTMEVNNCLSQPCYSGGTCNSYVDYYNCTCPTGTSGSRCEVDDIDECTSTPCKNGGLCVNKIGAFSCFCMTGFSGLTCESEKNVCDAEPCSNGATCVSLDNVRRRCDCAVGFSGKDCEINIDDCKSNPCLHGGSCVDGVNGYSCSCLTGYNDLRCQNRINPCNLGLCVSSTGTCVDDYTEDNYKCVCKPGYSYGQICDYNFMLDTASTGFTFSIQATANVGECHNLCDQYQASCVQFSYRSGNCSIYSSASSTKSETGTTLYTKRCIQPDEDYFSSWYSISTPTATGNEIERRVQLSTYGIYLCNGTEPLEAECRTVGTNISSSDTNDNFAVPCGINGIECTGSASNPCENYEVRYKCSVHEAFQSNSCNMKLYCSPGVCQNGGLCQNTFGGYVCNCPAGYTGLQCQHNIDNCVGNGCQNGATCMDGHNTYTCQCTAGYTGALCETNIDDCNPNPCDSRGTRACNDLIDGFNCDCYPGYTGKNCSVEIDECASNPCQHGGTCIDTVDKFICQCVSGWSGTRCEDIVETCNTNPCPSDSSCSNLFDNFYCNCPPSTYGVRCENSPNICDDVKPCLNSGVCSGDRGVAINCTCPNGNYKGKGCQTMVDHCANPDMCLNGGTCVSQSPGYMCQCMDGYSGDNCKTNVNDCVNASCPATSTCIDMVNSHYCRCPLGKTGNSCTRDLDTNYDLFFYLPTRNGYASLPYPIKLEGSAFSITIWVRYSQANQTGTFFTMFTTDSSNSLTPMEKLLSLDDEGVKVFDDDKVLEGKYQFKKVNDGKWHYVVLTWTQYDGFELNVGGINQLVNITAFTGSMINTNIWVSLGANYGDSDVMPVEYKGFLGYLSQLNIYNRRLDFENEIPKLYVTPRISFTGAILLWNEFILHRGVQPIYPSYASNTGCPGSTSGGTCTADQDKEAPTFSHCPSDIYVASQDRLTSVTWTPPVAQGAVTERKKYNSGQTFLWGKYINTYEAVDAEGNSKFCHFNIYVQYQDCPMPKDPYMGNQTCNKDYPPHTGCSIFCTTSDRVIDRYTQNIFTCGPSGSFDPRHRFTNIRYPSCGVKQAQAKKKLIITLSYPQISNPNCPDVTSALEIKLRETIVAINNAWSQQLCKMSDCSDVLFEVSCDFTLRRRKRQAPGTSQVTATLTVPESSPMLTSTSDSTNTLPAEDVLTLNALGMMSFDYPNTIPKGVIDPNGFAVDTSDVCQQYETLIDGQCVQCGAGNFFNVNTTICEDCPIGTFQSMDNQISCEQCPQGETTEMPGAVSSTECKASCPPGSYFSTNDNKCNLCKEGYYQSKSGQFYCDPCPVGQTTRNQGSNSSIACYDDCKSGEELASNGSCIPCQVGTYRSAGIHFRCEDCPSNSTTPSTGSWTESDCTLISCLAGNKRVGDNPGVCEKCPIGYYQDEKWQTSCKSCGGTRYTTDQVASSSKDQCKFFCPDGYEAKDENCQPCQIGFYKNNTEDKYGLCQPCSGNKRTAADASTSADDCTIYKCSAGYKPNATNNGCEPCPYGYYQDVQYSTDCKKCDANHSTKQMASTRSDQCVRYCESGYQVNAFSGCTACPVGTFKTNTDFKFDNCTECPQFYVTATNATTDVSACTVRNCSAGTKRFANDSGCEDCPLGYYQSKPYQTQCEMCGTNTYTRQTKSTKAEDCEAYCPSGEEKASDDSCVKCSVGYFKDNNVDVFSVCTLCNTDFITAGNGTKTEAECNVANCSAGQYRDVSNQCLDCPKGSYQPKKWMEACIQCPTDKTTSGVGAMLETECQLECSAGKEDRNGSCVPCDKGYYKSSSAAALCTPCPVNTTTVGTGSTSDTMCSVAGCLPGYYLTTGNQCELCPYDTYQPMKWQSQCLNCSLGTVTQTKGATTDTACILDCASGTEYDPVGISCTTCLRGYFRDKTVREQLTCQMCPPDRITPTSGGSGISACSQANCTAPGQYRNPQTNQCTDCPIGTFNIYKWRDECDNCPTGYTTPSVGSTTVNDCFRDCPSGQYADNNNICQMCIQGKYRNRSDSLTCQDCPTGLTTPTSGSISVNNCTLTTCAQGEYFQTGTSTCAPCAKGLYQDQPNQRVCKSCGRGQYTLTEGSTSITDCKNYCDNSTLCHRYATCSPTDNFYTCTCIADYKGDGSNCTHECDLGYCLRGTCKKSPTLSCVCPDSYEGSRCESRKDFSKDAQRDKEIIIIASAAGGAFLLIIIIIIVCCCTRAARKSSEEKYYENHFNATPVEKSSLYVPVGGVQYDGYSLRSRPPSVGGTFGRGMSQLPELTFDNPAYNNEQDVAVYHA